MKKVFMLCLLLIATTIFGVNVFASTTNDILVDELNQQCEVIFIDLSEGNPDGSYITIIPFDKDSPVPDVKVEKIQSNTDMDNSIAPMYLVDSVYRTYNIDLSEYNVAANLYISGNIKSLNNGATWMFDGSPQHGVVSVSQGNFVGSSITEGGSGYSYVIVEYTFTSSTGGAFFKVTYPIGG